MNLESIKWMKEGAIDLLVESWSSSALTLQIRGLNNNEMIIADHATSSDRSIRSEAIAVTAPPRLLTVRAASTSVRRGACFVRISLRVEGVIMATLFADYVTDTGAPAYPNGAIRSAVEGPGLIRSITGTDPAAGVEISETVPSGAMWRVLTFRFDLTTDATVATRNPLCLITDGTNELSRSSATSGLAASLTGRHTYAVLGIRDSVTGQAAMGPLPDNLRLLAGYTIGTATQSFQAGDNLTAPQLLVEEWINP